MPLRVHVVCPICGTLDELELVDYPSPDPCRTCGLAVPERVHLSGNIPAAYLHLMAAHTRVYAAAGAYLIQASLGDRVPMKTIAHRFGVSESRAWRAVGAIRAEIGASSGSGKSKGASASRSALPAYA